MKKVMILFLVFALVSIQFKNVLAITNKEVLGNWKYEVAGAPAGYDKGQLVFSEKEGKLIGEVKFADGYKIEMKEVKLEDGGVVKCGLYVDYEYISVNAKIEGNKMTGNVKTPEGDMKLTAVKEK